jgi:hypothetical protein
MPFLGLFGPDFREINKKGYHRLDLSNYTFKISPPPDNASPDMVIAIINVDYILWPMAKENWGAIEGLALYRDPDSVEELIAWQWHGPKNVKRGDQICSSPGALCISSTLDRDIGGSRIVKLNPPLIGDKNDPHRV